MEYQALYRKYRPKVFGDVIGQEHIIKTLKNQIARGKISHAYLFCGTRGTGKTSTAKIFARAINCLAPADGEPCMECEMCIADLEGRSVNVIEIDAASNRGIDSIKELREDIRYAPAQGTYKVYIIDEIHMLTTEAFNALLKTLEEPPKHVVFILATTDPQKIPATILSRCQRYDFKRITSEEITGAIKKYLELEGINADEDAVRYVAYLGDGSMRDSLSILDQCLAYFSDEHITLEKILDVTGDVDISFYKDISDGIFDGDTRKVLEVLAKAMSMGRDINRFVSGYISYLRNMLVSASVQNAAGILDVSGEILGMLKAQAKKTSVLKIMYMIERLSKLLSDIRYAANPYVLAEVEFIRFSAGIVISENSTEALEIKIAQLESIIRNGNFRVNGKEEKASSKPDKAEVKSKPAEVKKKAEEKILDADNSDIEKISDAVKGIMPELKSSLRSFLSKAELKKGLDGKLYYVCRYKTHADFINKGMPAIKELLSDKFGMEPNIKAVCQSEFDAEGNPADAEEIKNFQEALKSRFSEEDAEDIVFLD